jgi:hypothetical protein
MRDHAWRESIAAEGGHLIRKIEHAIAEGNVRKIEIIHNGQIVAEFPLSVGVAGAVLAPVLAAIGATAALLTDCRIEVERVSQPK